MNLTQRLTRAVPVACAALTAAILACSGGSSSSGTGGPNTQTGSSCTSASACYPSLDAGALHGQVTCLTQLQNGYCTHTCASDADCCAATGECPAGIKEICASFESSGQMYCFVSCASADITADPNAGTTDPTAFCQKVANASFTCRSTGGGRNNQQFCGP